MAKMELLLYVIVTKATAPIIHYGNIHFNSACFFPDCQFFQTHSVYVAPAITCRASGNSAELRLRFSSSPYTFQ